MCDKILREFNKEINALKSTKKYLINNKDNLINYGIEKLLNSDKSYHDILLENKDNIYMSLANDIDMIIEYCDTLDDNIFNKSNKNSKFYSIYCDLYNYLIIFIRTDETIEKFVKDNLLDSFDYFIINYMTWNSIYSKFAKVLNQFYNEFGEKSGKKLFKRYKKQDKNFEILSWVKHFKDYNVSSLDPIHIFASFTYWNIPLETRKKKMLFFCELLSSFEIDVDDLESDINKAIDSDYQYLPHPNITYIVSARNHKTQKEVWKFFSLVYNNEDNNKLEEIFNKINIDWYGIKIESATIFSFWVNSSNFLPLDKNTLDLLKKYNKLDKIPSAYKEYKKILIKKDTSLYRNLAKIANNESLKSDLSPVEKKEIDSFFEKEIRIEGDRQGIISSGTTATQTIEIDKDSTNTIVNYDNKLEKIEDFEFELYFIISGRAKRIVYKKGKIESINELKIKSNKEDSFYQNFQLIAIKAWDKKYTKVLTTNKLYYFNKNFEILDNILKIKHKNNINLYKDFNVAINITAIVGKNGTGKSTIIELLLMALNNITASLSSKDKLIYPLEELFYTVHTNYSIYSLNTRDYSEDWLNKLFHKNDHYQVPIVIEPYREEGNIDINVLNEVSKQRLLSSLLEPNINIDSTKLVEEKRATHLNISLDLEKITKMIKFLSDGETENIDEVLSYDENKKIIEYVNIKSVNQKIKYKKEAKLYICYKVKSIADTYYPNNKDKFYTANFVNKLLEDKTHITFKLHQAINYLKYHTVKDVGEKLLIEDLSTNIQKIQEENLLPVIELIPPAFFKVDIIINDSIPFNTLSSGEKQKVYSISSIIYHLQNIESVHRSNQENSIKYNHVNLILDEIELYFHPDMQRTYIYDLLEAIENKGGFNHINALNIIMVTHSPFILSDIVESNIMYLGRKDDDVEKTFGANIHTLLDNSFFMEEGLMGKFAKKKIEDIINKLTLHKLELSKSIKERDSKKLIKSIDKEDMKNVIENIGEPFLKKKLFDMYFSIFDEKENKVLILEREKKKLEEQIWKLQK